MTVPDRRGDGMAGLGAGKHAGWEDMDDYDHYPEKR